MGRGWAEPESCPLVLQEGTSSSFELFSQGHQEGRAFKTDHGVSVIMSATDSDLLITHHVSCEFNRFSSEGAGQLLLKW